MQDFDRTTKISRPASAAAIASNLLVTVFDGNTSPRTFSLDGTRGGSITFGRSEDNDIVLSSRLVSRQHGRFVYRKNQWFIEDKALYGDSASKNGLICNNVSVRSRALCEEDFIRIDDGVETIPEGVLFVFASQGASSKWDLLNLGESGRSRSEEIQTVISCCRTSAFQSTMRPSLRSTGNSIKRSSRVPHP